MIWLRIAAAGLFLGCAALWTAPAFSQCSRADVDAYLDKGFSRAQIAEICGGARTERRRRESDASFLKRAIDADEIQLTRRSLEYIAPVCLPVVNDPNVDARPEICPDVRFRVRFAGLEVKDSRRKFLVAGQREIKVKGRIERRLMSDLKEYPASLHHEIMRVYRQQARVRTAYIPLRDGVSVKRVLRALRARTH